MKKIQLTAIVLGIILAATVGFVGFGVSRSIATTPQFGQGGYILLGDTGGEKKLEFAAGADYTPGLAGDYQIKDLTGKTHQVPRQSFVHLENGAIMALSDGVLLDFNDLTDNFINNYYIQAGLEILSGPQEYYANTVDNGGRRDFGEHILKLSDDKYIIRASTMTVTLNGEEPKTVNDYLQVSTSADGVVYLMSQENTWMTISDACTVETAGGVRILPVKTYVEDGNHQVGLSGLTVSMDDAIILSQDETRRQIVPELEFNVTHGEAGANGAAGAAGETGDIGETGDVGETGETGETGQTGDQGTAGQTGDKGQAGQTGQTGAAGETGEGGETGETGDTGSGGGTGRPGQTGQTGLTGYEGSKGDPGFQGPKGNDAQVESSTNNALPSMTITEWGVTATSLKGVIKVSDLSGMLNHMTSLGQTASYQGTVTITNMRTGEQIPCYESKLPGSHDYSHLEVGSEDTGFEGFYKGDGATVYFSTLGDPLTPDTEYRLSVRAYYTTTDDSGMVYAREFATRSFYTDSSGVIIGYRSATESSVTLSVAVSPSYKDSMSTVQVYLMSPEQNKTFTAAGKDEMNNYKAKRDLDGASFSSQPTQDVTVSGLFHNTTYIVRVYVETTGGLKTLTQQELTVITLKKAPTKLKADALPVANFNRQNGAFEIYRPTVVDPDGGAVRYTYTALRIVDGHEEEELTRTLQAGAGEPVEFRLASNNNYRFAVSMEFFDNEKTVYFDLGKSEQITAKGDTMPSMNLTALSNGQQYDTFKGRLRITLGPDSVILTGNNATPVTMELFANGLMTAPQVAELYTGDPEAEVGPGGNLGKVTLTTGQLAEGNSSTYIDLNLDLKNLYKNTTYAVTINGWLSLGDGNDPSYRTIGTVTFKTYQTPTLQAYFTAPSTAEAGSAALSQKLRLAFVPPADGDPTMTSLNAYSLNRMIGGGEGSTEPCGAVSVTVFHGMGAGRLQVGQKNFTEKEDLVKLFGSEGLVMTETDFQLSQVDSGAIYTFNISQAADSSFNSVDLGYVNTFDEILNNAGQSSGVTQPPDLLRDATGGVKATPIENKDAGKYGGTRNTVLPDNAVVGYILESTYDNMLRIGTSVSYYAFEMNAFCNAIQNFDPNAVLLEGSPMDNMGYLMKMTQPISSSSDEVPKVAIMFGGEKTASDDPNDPSGKGPVRAEGCMVYWTGTASYSESSGGVSGSLMNGMGRGFRYVFGYEAKYALSSGEDAVVWDYPYDHGKYQEYQSANGGFTVNNKKYGTAYLLTSKTCEAPLIMPDFHVYAESVDHQSATSSGVLESASGNFTIHYTWRDPEYEANKTDPYAAIIRDTTLIRYMGKDNTEETVPVKQDTTVTGENSANWYSLTMPFDHRRSELSVLTPTVDIRPYRLDYDIYLEEGDEDGLVLGPFYLDWSYDKTLSSTMASIQMEAYPDYNYIWFYLVGSHNHELASRAVAMSLTVTGEGLKTHNFILPVTYDGLKGYPGVKLQASMLGTEYLQKDFTVSNAVLYYDTGRQGWSYANQNAANTYYALQAINEEGLGTYYSASPSSGSQESINASGGLLRPSRADVPDALRATVNHTDREGDTRLSYTRYPVVMGVNSGLHYLYPVTAGVNSGTSDDPTVMGESYLVPKQVAPMNLKFAGEGAAPDGSSATGKLTDLVPTALYTSVGATAESLYFNGLNVSGLPAGQKVFMRLYSEKDSAGVLSTANIVTAKDVDGKPLTDLPLEIRADGYLAETQEQGDRFYGLKSKTYYYIVLFYKNSEGEDTLLLDQETGAAFVVQRLTSEENDIQFTKAEYINASYHEKRVEMDFSMSLITGQSLKYDIYSSELLAEGGSGGDGDVLNNDELLGTGTALGSPALLTIPGGYDHYNNKLTLHLDPKEARSKLLPGGTYWFRITSTEGSTTSYEIQRLTLDSIGSTSSLVSSLNATQTRVTFSVTLIDPQFSLMGPANANAVYAVRFTDDQGNRIFTTYDYKTYTAFEVDAMQRMFTLTSDPIYAPDGQTVQTPATVIPEKSSHVIGNNGTGGTYFIHVYAVPDRDHNGSVDLGDVTVNGTSLTDLKVSDLFTQRSVPAGQEHLLSPSLFHDIIDSFWTFEEAKKDGEGNVTVPARWKNNEDMDGVEDQMRLGRKSQSTLTLDSKWTVNATRAYLRRMDQTTVRVVLHESFGLLNENNESVFKKIAYSIVGTRKNGEVIQTDGTASFITGDKLIQQDASLSYFFDIPTELFEGTYSITVHFYLESGDTASAAVVDFYNYV